jgi:predicted TIM-barrel fold metal-dependent hydrolase
MLIIDTHIHLWESNTAPPHHRSRPMGADELVRAMDEAGIDRVVNCPAIWDRRANEVAAEAALRYPDRIGTMGWFDLAEHGDGRMLSRWKDQPGMLGLRFVVAMPEHVDWFRKGRLDWIWEAAQEYGIPVGLTVPLALDHVQVLGQRFPDLKIVIDHMGLGPFGKVPEVFDGRATLLQLAELPNLAVKVTAAPAYATDAFPFASVHPYVREIVEAFGAKRSFWGTDITRMACSWSECKTMFTEHLPWLTGDALEDVMGRAFCRWAGWAE